MNNAKPTLLVTGLSGLVGSRFLYLYADKYEMVNLDLTSGIDITDAASVEQIFSSSNAQAVVHLAAYTNVSAAYEQQGDTEGVCYKVNVLGTKTIAEAAQKYNKYLVHVSTDYVFDGKKQDQYVENDVPSPIEWYGQTKLWAEEAVAKSEVKGAILRMAFPYQANPSRPDFLAKVIENLKKNTLPPAFADHVITPTFVDDVTTVFDYCITHQPTGVYHMVGSSSHTDYEIASMVNEIFDLEGTVQPGSLTEYLKKVNRPYQQTMRVSNEKLTREFGIQMHTVPDGLREIKNQIM